MHKCLCEGERSRKEAGSRDTTLFLCVFHINPTVYGVMQELAIYGPWAESSPRSFLIQLADVGFPQQSVLRVFSSNCFPHAGEGGKTAVAAGS